MSKIQSLNLSVLRNEEAFGFLQQVQTETKHLADVTIESIVDNFSVALEEFDKALKESEKLPSVALARECDTARDTAWSGLNAYCKAVATYHPDTDVKAAAQKAYDIVLKYGNPIRLPQTQESGVLHNLLQDLNALAAEDRTKTALDAWINHLSECENNFLAAVGERTVEEAARINGIVKQTRTATETAYRKLVEVVNALNGLLAESDYTTFIDHVNALIDRQKTILKTRSTISAKKEEGTEGSTEE